MIGHEKGKGELLLVCFAGSLGSRDTRRLHKLRGSRPESAAKGFSEGSEGISLASDGRTGGITFQSREEPSGQVPLGSEGRMTVAAAASH
jgi:hypothetical protein